MTLNPANAEACRILGNLYRNQGRIADARTVCRRLTQIEPQEYVNHVNLASLSAQLGDNQSAEDALKKALLVRPEAALTYASLAQLYLNTGRPLEARSRIEEAIRRKPTAEWYMLLAAACEQLDDREGAVAAADKARRLSLDDPRFRQAPLP
jgi:predicted Zn-dependent protease